MEAGAGAAQRLSARLEIERRAATGAPRKVMPRQHGAQSVPAAVAAAPQPRQRGEPFRYMRESTSLALRGWLLEGGDLLFKIGNIPFKSRNIQLRTFCQSR